MDFAGGMEFVETGYRVRSANITPDADTGIGTWTEQQFIDKFKAFENADAARRLSEHRAPAEHADAVDRLRRHDARGPRRRSTRPCARRSPWSIASPGFPDAQSPQ